MGRAVMLSDVEPEDLFARREWARAVGGVGPGGWPLVAGRLAGWGCMIASMPRMRVRTNHPVCTSCSTEKQLTSSTKDT